MKVDVIDLNGNVVKQIELPPIFSEKVREDLIRRDFLAIMSKKRQPYGTDVFAGLRTSAHYHGKRRYRWTMMNREMARLPRLHGDIPIQQLWRARRVPQARGGRRAHPPKVEKIWEEKINKKERRRAVRSAIAATIIKEFVEKRGHKIEDLKVFPIVVSDDLQKISKTKELRSFLEKIGLKKELERIKKKKVRAGKGKMRGRRYRRKVGPLIVVSKDEGVSKACKNLGLDWVLVKDLSTEHLAPGGVPGRLTIWTESALEYLKKKR